MSDRRVRVLLVSHEASRTGAPRVAVLVARALRRQRGVRVVTVLRWPGPLEADLRAESDRLVREPLRRLRVLLRRRRRTRRLAVVLETAVAWAVLGVVRPDVVYANTTLSACYVRPALWWRRRVVLHVHELEPLATQTLSRYGLDGSWPRVEIVACSTAVAENLARVAGRAVDRVVHSVPDAEAIAALAAVENVASDRLVVGACGTPDHRKGVDLFGEIAARVDLADFVWVGGDAPAGMRDGPVRFVPATSNPFPLLQSFDVLAVTSREDPFPLVVLEAMALGTPVVAFDVGGLREQVGDAGVLVPAGDVDAFVGALRTLLADDAARGALAVAAVARVHDEFSIRTFDRSVADTVRGKEQAC